MELILIPAQTGNGIMTIYTNQKNIFSVDSGPPKKERHATPNQLGVECPSSLEVSYQLTDNFSICVHFPNSISWLAGIIIKSSSNSKWNYENVHNLQIL